MEVATGAAKLAIQPSKFTLYLRQSLPWQLWRFVVINLRMTVMILKSHDTRLPRSRDPASSRTVESESSRA